MNDQLTKIRIELPEKKHEKIIKREIKKQDPNYIGLKNMFLDLALKRFNNNQEHFAYHYAAYLFELLNYAKSEILEKVEILANGNKPCEFCLSQNGKQFLLKDAIEQMPIPHKECTTYKDDHLGKHEHGWCRCTWLPVVED